MESLVQVPIRFPKEDRDEARRLKIVLAEVSRDAVKKEIQLRKEFEEWKRRDAVGSGE